MNVFTEARTVPILPRPGAIRVQHPGSPTRLRSLACTSPTALATLQGSVDEWQAWAGLDGTRRGALSGQVTRPD